MLVMAWFKCLECENEWQFDMDNPIDSCPVCDPLEEENQ
jgi:rubrerythrin